MNYELEFKESALKEWCKLDNSIRELFKKRLAERLASPRVESARLTGLPDCYKINSATQGIVWSTRFATILCWLQSLRLANGKTIWCIEMPKSGFDDVQQSRGFIGSSINRLQTEQTCSNKG